MKYEAVIGLEVHVQVRTRSKMFCGCANQFAGEPNTRICPVCMGYPGVLPVINREAVRKTIMAGMMCDCRIAAYSKFDRKNYYYPDMPKNYQLSQFDLPLCEGGRVVIGGLGFSGEPLPDKTVGLTRIHLEEDVAKLMHPDGYSVIDFNRSGVPLMEIVSEPEMATPDQAYAYLINLKQIMQFADISDCDMEKGQMRCDINISMRPQGRTRFGTKAEIKNLNSFRAVHRAVQYEMRRQTEILRRNGTVNQETRRWDDAVGQTFLMRSKEEAHDYRYFPEPDLMPLSIDEDLQQEIAAAMPEAPDRRRQRFQSQYQLSDYDARLLTQEKPLADFFEAAAITGSSPKLIANWTITELLRELNERNLKVTQCPAGPEQLGELVALIENRTISTKIAKTVFTAMLDSGTSPRQIVAEKGLRQVSDPEELEKYVLEAIAENPGPVEQYRNGTAKAIQFLVGQVMKKSRGKANPQMVVELLQRNLQ